MMTSTHRPEKKRRFCSIYGSAPQQLSAQLPAILPPPLPLLPAKVPTKPRDISMSTLNFIQWLATQTDVKFPHLETGPIVSYKDVVVTRRSILCLTNSSPLVFKTADCCSRSQPSDDDTVGLPCALLHEIYMNFTTLHRDSRGVVHRQPGLMPLRDIFYIAGNDGEPCLVVGYPRGQCDMYQWLTSHYYENVESNKPHAIRFKPNFYNYIVRIAYALLRLHQKGITHGDLKLENVIVMSDESVVLTDLEGASLGQRLPAGPATNGYVAPELFMAVAAGAVASRPPSYDAWSFGVLIHACLTEHIVKDGTPAVPLSTYKHFHLICDHRYKLDDLQTFRLWHAYQGLLDRNPYSRITLANTVLVLTTLVPPTATPIPPTTPMPCRQVSFSTNIELLIKRKCSIQRKYGPVPDAIFRKPIMSMPKNHKSHKETSCYGKCCSMIPQIQTTRAKQHLINHDEWHDCCILFTALVERSALLHTARLAIIALPIYQETVIQRWCQLDGMSADSCVPAQLHLIALAALDLASRVSAVPHTPERQVQLTTFIRSELGPWFKLEHMYRIEREIVQNWWWGDVSPKRIQDLNPTAAWAVFKKRVRSRRQFLQHCRHGYLIARSWRTRLSSNVLCTNVHHSLNHPYSVLWM